MQPSKRAVSEVVHARRYTQRPSKPRTNSTTSTQLGILYSHPDLALGLIETLHLHVLLVAGLVESDDKGKSVSL